MAKNPFDTLGKGFNLGKKTGLDAFTATASSGKEEQQKRNEESAKMPVSVAFPPHLYVPYGAESVDMRRLANVTPGTNVELIRFTAPQGRKVKFIGYGVFCDALMFALVNFVPTVNGRRVFPYHGDPQRNFKIALGISSDLGNNALISCQLDLEPGQTLIWTFYNNDVVDVAAGVRMSGYVDSSIVRATGRFGG